MKPTKLVYMEHMHQLESDAIVESIEQKDDKTVVVLDQTVFYPQGGGQPFDTGVVTSDDTKFIVEEVRFVDGQVLHIGHFDGRPFIQGEDVKCKVDKDRRELNARLHSGGHILDMAVDRLGLDWIPGKGYHFPDGPYVEYEANIENLDTEDMKQKLEQEIAKIQSENPKVEVKFVTKDELTKLCSFVPDYLPKDKPARVVMYGDFGVPCGGIHVASLQDIGTMKIRKIKLKNKLLRVSYELE